MAYFSLLAASKSAVNKETERLSALRKDLDDELDGVKVVSTNKQKRIEAQKALLDAAKKEQDRAGARLNALAALEEKVKARKAAEERDRLLQETLDAAELTVEHLGLSDRICLAPDGNKSSSLQGSDKSSGTPMQSDECTGCFFMLGSKAVVFGCGHANCPECNVAVTSRKSLFGDDAGLELETVFVTRGLTPTEQRRLTRKQCMTKENASAIAAATKESRYMKTKAALEGQLDDGFEKFDTNEDGFLSMEEVVNTGQASKAYFDMLDTDGDGKLSRSEYAAVKIQSWARGQRDRRRVKSLREEQAMAAAAMRAAADAVFVAAAVQRQDENIQMENELTIETKETFTALRNGEDTARVKTQALMNSAIVELVKKAKLVEKENSCVLEKAKARLSSAKNVADRKRGVSAIPVFQDQSTNNKVIAIQEAALQTMTILQRDSELPDETRENLIDQLAQLQDELESEACVLQTELHVSNLAVEGLDLAPRGAEAERSLFSISQALVQHAGVWYEQQMAERQEVQTVTDTPSPSSFVSMNSKEDFMGSESIPFEAPLVRVSGALLYAGGMAKTYDGFNGDFQLSDERCNQRAVYTHVNMPWAIWYANVGGKLCWCVGKEDNVGTDTVSGYVESTGAEGSRNSGPQEVGRSTWFVYSFNNQSWEEQTGIEVVVPDRLDSLSIVDRNHLVMLDREIRRCEECVMRIQNDGQLIGNKVVLTADQRARITALENERDMVTLERNRFRSKEWKELLVQCIEDFREEVAEVWNSMADFEEKTISFKENLISKLHARNDFETIWEEMNASASGSVKVKQQIEETKNHLHKYAMDQIDDIVNERERAERSLLLPEDEGAAETDMQLVQMNQSIERLKQQFAFEEFDDKEYSILTSSDEASSILQELGEVEEEIERGIVQENMTRLIHVKKVVKDEERRIHKESKQKYRTMIEHINNVSCRKVFSVLQELRTVGYERWFDRDDMWIEEEVGDELPHLLGLIRKQPLSEIIQQLEDEDAQAAANAAAEAAAKAAAKAAAEAAKLTKKRNWFSFGGTSKKSEAANPDDADSPEQQVGKTPSPSQKKQGRLDGIVGGVAIQDEEKKGAQMEMKKKKEKKIEMAADAVNALAQISEAQKKVVTVGEEKRFLLLMWMQTEIIHKQIKEYTIAAENNHQNNNHDLADQYMSLLAELQEGVQLAEKVRGGFLEKAQVAMSKSEEHEARNEFNLAFKQGKLALQLYEALELMEEFNICRQRLEVMPFRVGALPHINEGLRRVELALTTRGCDKFRTLRYALAPLEEARRLLLTAPKRTQHLTRESINQIEENLKICQEKMKEEKRVGPRYWKRAQQCHAVDTPEAQSKASLLYHQAASAFNNVEEERAERESKRMQKLTEDNAVNLAFKKAAHLEMLDRCEESIELYTWLKAWLEHCKRSEEIIKVEQIERSAYRKRAKSRLIALTHICDDGLPQLKRGYRKGEQLLEMTKQDLGNDGCEENEENQISILSHRLKELQRISDMWVRASKMDPKLFYDERMSEFARVKKDLLDAGVAGDRLEWDIQNFMRGLAEQRKYQAAIVGEQTGADKVFEQALLELRKLRAHMQLSFDDCLDHKGRGKIEEMANTCRSELVKASEVYQDCESWEKKRNVEKVLADVDFELERWIIRQDDLKVRLKELTANRRAHARAKLAREAVEDAAANEKNGQPSEIRTITEDDISKEVCRVDGERKLEFGKLEEGKLDFNRSQILYESALAVLKEVDENGAQRASNMLQGLAARELEFEEMIATSNLAAQNLWDERAEMLCRQAKKRTEKIGGPSQTQFDSGLALRKPAAVRESVMASYGARFVFRPSFDTEPMPITQRSEGITHAVNLRPFNERTWLHTESLYNSSPGKLAVAKFCESLAPAVPTTKANFYALPKPNLSTGLIHAPESERPDYRILPIGPSNRPRPP